MKLPKITIRLSWIAVLAGIVAAFSLLSYRLGSLVPGLSATEIGLANATTNLHALWSAPLNAPMYIARLLVNLTPYEGFAGSRAPSVILALGVLVLSYWLINKWYGPRLALFGMTLFATASGFLHVARLASFEISYVLAVVTVLLLAAVWHNKKISKTGLYMSAVAIAGLLYIPGALWLLLAVVVFEYKNIAALLKQHRKHTIFSGLTLAALLIPLMHMLATNWRLYRPLLGLPDQWVSPISFLSNILQSWQYLFIGGLQDPVHNLGQLPLVNAFVTLAFLVGIFLYAKHPKAARSRQLLAVWLVSTLLIALEGPFARAALLPIVFVVATGGIGYLLHLWLRTFPKNPYARAFGIACLGVVVLFAISYNVRKYYVAWPNSPATQSSFKGTNLQQNIVYYK